MFTPSLIFPFRGRTYVICLLFFSPSFRGRYKGSAPFKIHPSPSFFIASLLFRLKSSLKEKSYLSFSLPFFYCILFFIPYFFNFSLRVFLWIPNILAASPRFPLVRPITFLIWFASTSSSLIGSFKNSSL